MKIGYARISTREQNLDMQVIALEEAGCEKIYEEVVSGVKAQRPKLDSLLKQLRPDDVLVVWKLDRLGRSLSLAHTCIRVSPTYKINANIYFARLEN